MGKIITARVVPEVCAFCGEFIREGERTSVEWCKGKLLVLHSRNGVDCHFQWRIAHQKEVNDG